MSRLLHGGVRGFWPLMILRPDNAHHRFVDGCPDCELHKRNLSRAGGDPATPHGWIYATSDRDYARFYASRAIKGWLYEVEFIGESEASIEDPPQFPTWRGRKLVVRRVLEKNIVLTMIERQALFIRWGGTAEEFDRMVREMSADKLRRLYR